MLVDSFGYFCYNNINNKAEREHCPTFLMEQNRNDDEKNVGKIFTSLASGPQLWELVPVSVA